VLCMGKQGVRQKFPFCVTLSSPKQLAKSNFAIKPEFTGNP